MTPHSYLAQLGYERTFCYRPPKEASSTAHPQPKPPRRITSALFPSLGLTAMVVYRMLRTLFVTFLLLSIIPVSLAEPHTHPHAQPLTCVHAVARTTVRTMSRRDPASPPERPRTPAPPPGFTTMPGHLALHGSVLHLLRARDLAGSDATDIQARIAERAANTAQPPAPDALAASRVGSRDSPADSSRDTQSSPQEYARRHRTFSCLSTPNAPLLPAAGSAGTPQPSAGYCSSWASARRGRSAVDRGLRDDARTEEHADAKPENLTSAARTPADPTLSADVNNDTHISAHSTTHTRTLGVPVPTPLLSRAQLRAAERCVPGGYVDGSHSCAYYPCIRNGRYLDPLREPEVVRAELARRARRAGPGLSSTGQPVRRVHVFQPLGEASDSHAASDEAAARELAVKLENTLKDTPKATDRKATNATAAVHAETMHSDTDAMRKDSDADTVKVSARMRPARAAVYSPMRHRYPLSPSAYPALRDGELTLPPMSDSVPVPPVAEGGEPGMRRLIVDTEALIAALKRVAEKQRSADTYAAAVAALDALPPPASLKEAQARNLARAAAGAAVEVHKLAERAALALVDAEKALQEQQELLRGAHAGARKSEGVGRDTWRESPLQEANAMTGEVDDVERERGDERSRDRTVAMEKEEPRSTDVMLPRHRRMVVVAVRESAPATDNREATSEGSSGGTDDGDTGKINATHAGWDTTEDATTATDTAAAHAAAHTGRQARSWGHHSRRQRYIDRRQHYLERLRRRQHPRHSHPRESLVNDLVHACRLRAVSLPRAYGTAGENDGAQYVRELLERDSTAHGRGPGPLITNSRHGERVADSLVARRNARVMRAAPPLSFSDTRSADSMGPNGSDLATTAYEGTTAGGAGGTPRAADEYYYYDNTPEEDVDDEYTRSAPGASYDDNTIHHMGRRTRSLTTDRQGANKDYRGGVERPASAEDSDVNADMSAASGLREDERQRVPPRRGRAAVYSRDYSDSAEEDVADDADPILEESTSQVFSMRELLRAAGVALEQVARGKGPALQAVGIYGPDRCACGEECTLGENGEWRCERQPPRPGNIVDNDSNACAPEASELADASNTRTGRLASNRTRTRTLGMRCSPVQEAVDAVLADTIAEDPSTVQRVVNMDAEARARAAVPVALLARRRIIAAEEGVDLAAVEETDTPKERDNALPLESLPSTHNMRTMSGCCRQECVLRCSDLSPHYDAAACAYELDWCARYYAPAAHDRFVDPDTANAYMAAYGSRDIPMADTVAAANTTAALMGGPAPLIAAPYTPSSTPTTAPTDTRSAGVIYTYTDNHGNTYRVLQPGGDGPVTTPTHTYTTVTNANTYTPHTTHTHTNMNTYHSINNNHGYVRNGGHTYTPGRPLRGGTVAYGGPRGTGFTVAPSGNGARAGPAFRSVRRVY